MKGDLGIDPVVHVARRDAQLVELAQQRQRPTPLEQPAQHIVIEQVHAPAGRTKVPCFGRAPSKPLAASIFTTLRVSERLTPCCLTVSASVGNGRSRC